MFERGMIIVLFFSPFLSFLINDELIEKKFNLIEFHFDAISREVLLQQNVRETCFLFPCFGLFFDQLVYSNKKLQIIIS